MDSVVWDPNVFYSEVNVYILGLWKHERKADGILLNK